MSSCKEEKSGKKHHRISISKKAEKKLKRKIGNESRALGDKNLKELRIQFESEIKKYEEQISLKNMEIDDLKKVTMSSLLNNSEKSKKLDEYEEKLKFQKQQIVTLNQKLKSILNKEAREKNRQILSHSVAYL